MVALCARPMALMCARSSGRDQTTCLIAPNSPLKTERRSAGRMSSLVIIAALVAERMPRDLMISTGCLLSSMVSSVCVTIVLPSSTEPLTTPLAVRESWPSRPRRREERGSGGGASRAKRTESSRLSDVMSSRTRISAMPSPMQ